MTTPLYLALMKKKPPHYNPYVADAAFNHPVPGISQPLRSIRRKVYGLPKSK